MKSWERKKPHVRGKAEGRSNAAVLTPKEIRPPRCGQVQEGRKGRDGWRTGQVRLVCWME